MKVAFLFPDFFNPSGGVGLYAHGLIRQFAHTKDTDMHILTADTNDIRTKERIQQELGEQVTIHTVCRPMDSVLSTFAYQIAVGKEFPELHARYEFDIIHAANLVHLPDLFLKMKKVEVPMVTTAHTTFRGHVIGLFQSTRNPFALSPRERLDVFAYPLLALAEKYYLKRTRHLITLSKSFKERLRVGYRFKGDVRVIHNSIDAGYYNLHTITKKKCYDRFPQLKKIRAPIILYAGRLVPQKGLVVFLKALRKLELEGVRPNVLIAGPGKETELRGYIRKTKVDPSRIHFFGFVNNLDLAYLYKISDVFVLPSFYEHFPISLLEAMSLECCPIATDVGAVDEIIDHEQNGMVIRPGDVESLAVHLMTCAKNLKLTHKLGKEGRQKVHVLFSADQMAMKTRAFYEEIIGRNS
jgi:glycosyltransferase involved in cell wall biosynthesis